MLALVIGMALALLPAPQSSANRADQLVEALRNRIEAGAASGVFEVRDDPVLATGALTRFYVDRLFEPAWVDTLGLTPRVRDLVAAIRGAALEGLQPEDYHLQAILAAAAAVRAPSGNRRLPDIARLADLELLCTDAFALLGSHFLSGRVNPETIDAEWTANRRGAQFDVVLDAALAAGNIGDALRALLPQQPGYARLRDALAQYRELAATGKWLPFPAAARLAAGDRDSLVRQLRDRLTQTGEFQGGASTDEMTFDSLLTEAVRLFQARHGLAVTGVVDSLTAAELSVPVNAWVRRIELNMERWRWLPADLGIRHILVNIAGFDLDVVDAGEVVLTMRAVVGRTYRRTPVFSGAMTYLVLAPYWHVPRNLAVQDQLPLIRRNPQHFAAQGIRVFQGSGADAVEVDPSTVDWASVTARDFPYRLRQDPGPRNALGQVKFMFPNRFNVYLHDTPARELFDRPQRDFSSGCIRIEKPLELAAYLLAGTPWTPDRIRGAVQAWREQTVPLPQPIPVHILYWTAWAGADGTLHFRRDIYERDTTLASALREQAPTDD
jgi:murein L,D-transpeptidase YcbB/YkuD